jgi:hypothetical protein
MPPPEMRWACMLIKSIWVLWLCEFGISFQILFSGCAWAINIVSYGWWFGRFLMSALHSKDRKSGTSSRAGWLYNSPIQSQPPQSHLMPRGLQSPTLSFFFLRVSHFEAENNYFFCIPVFPLAVLKKIIYSYPEACRWKANLMIRCSSCKIILWKKICVTK